MEDYLANRKGPGQGTTLPGFGQTQQQQQQQQPGAQLGSTGLFGTSTGTSLFGSKPPENKSLFGTSTSTGERKRECVSTHMFTSLKPSLILLD